MAAPLGERQRETSAQKAGSLKASPKEAISTETDRVCRGSLVASAASNLAPHARNRDECKSMGQELSERTSSWRLCIRALKSSALTEQPAPTSNMRPSTETSSSARLTYFILASRKFLHVGCL